MIEHIVHVIQGEDIEVLAAIFRLIIVVQEHLSHVVDRYSTVDLTVQTQGAVQVGQRSDVVHVGKRDQYWRNNR